VVPINRKFKGLVKTLFSNPTRSAALKRLCGLLPQSFEDRRSRVAVD
jgi:hypothetical protein